MQLTNRLYFCVQQTVVDARSGHEVCLALHKQRTATVLCVRNASLCHSLGCTHHVFLHVQAMVDIVKHGLNDENQKVKTITALTVSALAEAASPYGIESFDDVLEPLWKGIRLLRGKVSCCLMLLSVLL